MKTTKLLLTGVLLTVATAFMCYGQTSTTASTTDLLNTINSLTASTSTSSTSTVTGAPNFLTAVASYMDKNQLSAYYAAFSADQLSASPSTPEGFFLDYAGKHADFQASYLAAVKKAKDALGIKSDDDLNTAMQKQIDDLKKQITDNQNLNDDQKQKYTDLMDKYAQQAAALNQQLTSSQSAVSQAIQALAQKPQQQDPMQQMMPMIMMMLMQMMGGGGGGQSKCGG